MKSGSQKYLLWTIISVVLMVGIWKVLSLCLKSNLILPAPEKVVVSAFKLLFSGAFWQSVGATVLRGIIGFAIAIVSGIGVGIPAGISPRIRALISPFIVVIRSIPVVAFILLALIWFSVDNVPVFIGLLTMFPLVTTNVIEGMKNVDHRLLEMATFYKIRRRRIVSELYIPAITPFIFSGIRSAIGIGWRAIIVGEVLSLPLTGIGTAMHNAQTFLNVDQLIAWTLIAVLLSYLFEMVVKIIEKLIVKWR